jgi:2-oxoisovalerate dehydrogenase E1 component
VPILFVCEDNGWGVSVPTPSGWIEYAYGSRPGWTICSPTAPIRPEPARWSPRRRRVREKRRPVFLHLRTVRFLGHAGSDAEISYRTPREVEADYRPGSLTGHRSSSCAPPARTRNGSASRYDQIRAEIDGESTRCVISAASARPRR